MIDDARNAGTWKTRRIFGLFNLFSFRSEMSSTDRVQVAVVLSTVLYLQTRRPDAWTIFKTNETIQTDNKIAIRTVAGTGTKRSKKAVGVLLAGENVNGNIEPTGCPDICDDSVETPAF